MTIYNSTTSTFYRYYHHRIESINEPTAINDLTSIDYDPIGAAYFIIIVLLWYSISVIFMLGMRIRTRSEIIEDCVQRRVKLFIKTLRDQTQTKQILEELVDKQKRDKLWNIYFGKTYNKKHKLKHAEILRIKNIKKQLTIINHHHMIMNDTFISPIVNSCIYRRSSNSRSKFISKLSSNVNQKCIRRCSSFDRQIIQHWKSIIDQNKAHEQQIPWTIKKVLIHLIIVFVLCQFPLLILNAWYAIDPHGSYHNLLFQSLNTIGVLLIVFNTSTNFLLYCFFGQKFRQTLIEFILHILPTKRKSTSLQNRSTKSIQSQQKQSSEKNHQEVQRILSKNSESIRNSIKHNNHNNNIKPNELNQQIVNDKLNQNSIQSTSITQEVSHPLITKSEQILIINENFPSKFDQQFRLCTSATGKRILILRI
ncbi:unnamed protein product [Rotaria sp. Silwood2]|nr:unnamed protein product [Rotaria sp. Silwood2]